MLFLFPKKRFLLLNISKKNLPFLCRQLFTLHLMLRSFRVLCVSYNLIP